MKIEEFDFIQYDKDIRGHTFELDREAEFAVGSETYNIKLNIVVTTDCIPVIIAEMMQKVDAYKNTDLETLKVITNTWWDTLNNEDKETIIKLVNN